MWDEVGREEAAQAFSEKGRNVVDAIGSFLMCADMADWG